MKLKVGDRVKDDGFLGSGVITELVTDIACMVLFDNTPPVRYNFGRNPALMFNEYLTKEINEMSVCKNS